MPLLSLETRLRRVRRLPARAAARLRGVRAPFETPEAQALAAWLREVFGAYRTERLVGIDAATFESTIRARLDVVDAAVEGYDAADLARQRDLSIRFTWGHTHDFGAFAVPGEMGERHLELMAHFLSLFDLPTTHVRDRDVLDVGCWTGGTTLLLAALGARVVAIEEVRKYAATARFLAESFGLASRVQVQARSIYACADDDLRERFDTIYFPGVVYHLSDPLLALRILFNALRVGGDILVESAGLDVGEPVCRFDGSLVVTSGTREAMNRAGWNWFMPSPSALARMMREAGFDDVTATWHAGSGRVFARGRKTGPAPICRAGLSVPGIP